MPRKNRQIEIPYNPNFLKKELRFGGSLLKNSHAKTERPLATKTPIHLVLRSSHAYRSRSFLYRKNRHQIPKIIKKTAKKFSIRVDDIANVGNHIHLVIRIHAGNLTAGRIQFNKFIRAVTGLIARAVLNIRRDRSVGVRFWDQRPFTRIVESWRGIRIIKNYIKKNLMESWGIFPEEVIYFEEPTVEDLNAGFV